MRFFNTLVLLYVTLILAILYVYLRPEKDLYATHLDVPRIELPEDDFIVPEAKWEDAAIIPTLNFIYFKKSAGLSGVPTSIKLLWSPKWLFVRFICDDNQPFAPYTGRDQKHHQGDVAEILIGPDIPENLWYKQQWYEIQVTPTNQILDVKYTYNLKHHAPRPRVLYNGVVSPIVNSQLKKDLTYDIPLHTNVQVHKNGSWVADIAIPAEILRPQDRTDDILNTGDTILANFVRYERWKPGTFQQRLIPMSWIPTRYGKPNISPSRMRPLNLVNTLNKENPEGEP